MFVAAKKSFTVIPAFKFNLKSVNHFANNNEITV